MEYTAKKAYRDHLVASGYDAKRFRGWKGRLTHKLELSLIDRALKKAGITPPAAILDLPCGTGRLSLHLAQQGYRVTGMDISRAMVSRAEEKIRRFQLESKFRLVVGDAETLPYSDAGFAACVSLRLFGHTPPPVRQKIIGELKRVSRQFLILGYYHRRTLQNLLRRQVRKKRGVMWHPVTSQEVQNELALAGLREIQTFYLAEGLSETMVVICGKEKHYG